MLSPFATRAVDGTAFAPDRIDWKQLKRQIVETLGPHRVYEAFSELGVRFESKLNGHQKAQCHAMDRPDEVASAFVNVVDGIYHARGGSNETLHLFDFALKYGSFGDWLTTVKHYAESAGVPINVHKDSKGRVLESTYDYHDISGKLIYQVVRYRLPNGKKTFRQRRPDGSGNWINDLNGVERVLYRLPEIVANPSHDIIVVEGEKDADRLNEILRVENVSAIATTGAQGAADTDRWSSYAESLKDRVVVVVADNDPDGLRHGHGICRSLYGLASSIKLIELPNVGPKGDVSDWIDQGNSLNDLYPLIVAAQPWEPSQVPVDGDPGRDATAVDLIAANAGARALWPQWIYFGVLTLITAEPSTGKTRFGLDLTKRIVLGTEWPDGQPIDLAGRNPIVLWIPADSQHSELADSPKAFGFPPEAIVLNTIVSDLYGGTELSTEPQLKDLYNRIVRVNPALVIIDTITNTSDAKSQDTSDAKRQYKPLQEIAKRTGAPIVCITHTNIGGKTLGRRADEKTRVTIRLECPDPDSQPNRRKLWVALSRFGPLPPALGVTMGNEGNAYDLDPPVGPEVKEAAHKPKQPAPAVQTAMGWLITRLQHGPVRVQFLRNEAEGLSPPISSKSLYKAMEYLGVVEFERESVGTGRTYKFWRRHEDGSANGEAEKESF